MNEELIQHIVDVIKKRHTNIDVESFGYKPLLIMAGGKAVEVITETLTLVKRYPTVKGEHKKRWHLTTHDLKKAIAEKRKEDEKFAKRLTQGIKKLTLFDIEDIIFKASKGCIKLNLSFA